MFLPESDSMQHSSVPKLPLMFEVVQLVLFADPRVFLFSTSSEKCTLKNRKNKMASETFAHEHFCFALAELEMKSL